MERRYSRYDLPKLQRDLLAWQPVLSTVRCTINDLCNTLDLDRNRFPIRAHVANLVQVRECVPAVKFASVRLFPWALIL
jgi:hypothetical protein